MTSQHTKFIRFTCDCGVKLKAPVSRAGSKGRCNACGGPVMVPMTSQNGSPAGSNGFFAVHPSRLNHEQEMHTNDFLKLIMGISGAATLFIAPFSPLFSLPFAGRQNYFQVHWFPPTLFLSIAMCSLLFSLLRKHSWLWVTATASSALVALTIIGFVFRVEIVRDEMKMHASNDPLSGLAGDMAELTAEAMRLDWGMGVFLIGTCLIFAAAAIPEKVSGTVRFSPRKPDDSQKKLSGASEVKLQDIADFLGKMKEGIDHGAARVTEKSKEMYGISKIKRRLASLEKCRDADLERLGKLVFQMHANDDQDSKAVEKICRAIAGLEEEIQENKEEIKRVQMQAAGVVQDGDNRNVSGC